MSITYKFGNIFTTNTECIGHGVNCRGGFGSGMAGAIATHCPEAKRQYLIKFKKEGWTLGEIQTVDCHSKIIINMATQENYGSNGIFADYEAIRECLQKSLDFCRKMDYTLSIPRIGSGLGGLDWNKVKIIIEETMKKYPDIYLEVWTYA